MRILFAADVPPDPNSGAAGTEWQTIQALRRLGHEVDEIWAEDLPHRIRHNNLHYLIELPGGMRRAVTKACNNKQYDVIQCCQAHSFLAAREHRLLGRPGVFISRSHGFEARAAQVLGSWRKRLDIRERRFPKSMLGYFVDRGIDRHCRWLVQSVDGLIVSCSEEKEFLVQYYRLRPEMVACIAQAPPDLYLKTETPAFGPERLQRFLCVGPPQFWKGPHILGAALEDVFRTRGDLQLTWVCGEEEWDKAKAFLSETVRRQTTFLPPMSQDQLMKVYDSHGILLFPSLFEGFGKAFLEAMARGLCVVASCTGGMRDVIRNREDGLLFEAGNFRQMTEAINWLLVSPDQAKAMSEQARRRVGGFSWDRVGLETETFFSNLHQLKEKKGGI